ncbi:putative Glycine cleavage system H protein [Candidatus Hydrogenisulfobacillus filiaventi]|uniref:Putative Glycine cleavage system H protein n=1 Tax=Candidatus Hydrogenisulfobacillus filiaventi TaxID=2707344 RepID=A0A6F8ZFF3_9FIRM|nr:glycine cleavage system protein H [Bacillota bacterium]CAB1128192.1 putative Glycine cleavage system H protein [Candidatus Hydrogenisulfobacillus filiaventi]
MAVVRGCNVPEDRYYWIDKHVWARPVGDLIEVGITDAGQKLAGKMLVCHLKPPGRTLKRGQTGGSLESGKWVGGISTPVSGTIAEINKAVEADPEMLNNAPYDNWLFRIQPSDWEADKAQLVTGDEALKAYEAKIEADNIQC